ncbi:MAG: helix-turn-helix transcriptional regulator [Bacteroidetes bacterium]|nr:helix-turn-helix transcriptional regulator [Bacteroidota bacterium]
MSKKQTLGDRVRELRDHYRHSQITFGERVNLSHIAVGRIESGFTKNPQGDTINRIAEAYGTSVEWLMEGKGEMLPNGKEEAVKANKSFDPATDTLYKELKEQIAFYRDLLTQMAGGKRNFLQALNLTGSRKHGKQLGAAA